MKFLLILLFPTLLFAGVSGEVAINILNNSGDGVETDHMYTDILFTYEETFKKNELDINLLIQSSSDEAAHFIPKTAVYKRPLKKNFEFKIGTEIFNISSMEGFKTANVFNAMDFTNDYLDPEEIGELVFHLSKQINDSKSIEFFYHLNFAPNEYATYIETSNGRIEFREDEIFEMLSGVSVPESQPPNSLIMSSIFSSYGEWWDWKLFAHFGYDRKYNLYLIDSNTRVLPLYMPDTILGYSFVKPYKAWLFKAEMASHIFQLNMPDSVFRYSEINPAYNFAPPQRNRFTEYSFGLEYAKTIKNYDFTFYLEHILIKNNNTFRNEDIGFLNNDILFAVNMNFNNKESSTLKFSMTRALNSSGRETMSLKYESEWMPKVRYDVSLKQLDSGDSTSNTNFFAQLPVEQQFKISAKYFF
jgi:hypothetical protein